MQAYPISATNNPPAACKSPNVCLAAIFKKQKGQWVFDAYLKPPKQAGKLTKGTQVQVIDDAGVIVSAIEAPVGGKTNVGVVMCYKNTTKGWAWVENLPLPAKYAVKEALFGSVLGLSAAKGSQVAAQVFASVYVTTGKERTKNFLSFEQDKQKQWKLQQVLTPPSGHVFTGNLEDNSGAEMQVLSVDNGIMVVPVQCPEGGSNCSNGIAIYKK